jgi:hypothetical protein
MMILWFGVQAVAIAKAGRCCRLPLVMARRAAVLHYERSIGFLEGLGIPLTQARAALESSHVKRLATFCSREIV